MNELPPRDEYVKELTYDLNDGDMVFRAKIAYGAVGWGFREVQFSFKSAAFVDSIPTVAKAFIDMLRLQGLDQLLADLERAYSAN